MKHLQAFQSRKVLTLPLAHDSGWQLKRYAILANGRSFDNNIASSALREAIARLPQAGKIDDQNGNHGVGFQIIHFAEVAVVSPVFYWQWGSVLANIEQIRAPWEQPKIFGNGVKEVVGCVWEMQVVSFEVNAWKNTVLSNTGTSAERLSKYLEKNINKHRTHCAARNGNFAGKQRTGYKPTGKTPLWPKSFVGKHIERKKNAATAPING